MEVDLTLKTTSAANKKVNFKNKNKVEFRQWKQMKPSININSTILFYIFQVKTYKRMPYQDVFYAFMMNINNNVGISTTATTT